MPQSAVDIANFVRAQVPALKGEPDHMLVKFLFDTHPEWKQDTLAASSTEANRMQAQEGQYGWRAGLHNFVSQGLSNLKGIGSGLLNKAQTIGLAPDDAAAIQKDPEGFYNQHLQALGKPVTAPIAAAKSKTPGEFGRNMADVATTTIPAVLAGGQMLRGMGGAALEVDPLALQTKANALREAYIPATLKNVAQSVDITKPLTALEAANNLTRPARASVYEKAAKLVAGPPSPKGALFPESDTFQTPGPIDRPDPAQTIATDELKRSAQWDAAPKVYESGPLGIVRPTDVGAKQTLQELRQRLEPEPGQYKAPAQHGDPIEFNPSPAWRSNMPGPPGSAVSRGTTSMGMPPKSPHYSNVLSGIPEDTIKLLGRGKLYSIARDAESILKEQGTNVLDKIDEQVGGQGVRQRLLSTPEGQNTIANLTNAMRRSSARDVMFYSQRLQSLLERVK